MLSISASERSGKQTTPRGWKPVRTKVLGMGAEERNKETGAKGTPWCLRSWEGGERWVRILPSIHIWWLDFQSSLKRQQKQTNVCGESEEPHSKREHAETTSAFSMPLASLSLTPTSRGSHPFLSSFLASVQPPPLTHAECWVHLVGSKSTARQLCKRLWNPTWASILGALRKPTVQSQSCWRPLKLYHCGL